MRRTAKFLLEAIALLAAGMAILGIFLVVRLASGPLSVGFATPYIVESLEPTDGSLKLSLRDTVLTWNGRARALQFRVLDVRIADAAGETKAYLPELTLGLSARALLRGRLAPTSLEVVGLRLRLMRDADGALQITEASPASEDAADGQGGADVFRAVLEDLLVPPDPRSDLGYLTSFSLIDADVTLDDRKLDVEWRAPSTTIVLSRGSEFVRLRGAFGLQLGGGVADFGIEASYDIEHGDIGARLGLKEIVPAMFAGRAPLLAPLAGVDLPVSGSLRLEASSDGTVHRLDIDIVAGAGRARLPWEAEDATVEVRSAVLRGSLTENLTVAEFDQFTVALGPEEQGTVLDARLSAAGEQAGVIGGAFTLNADVALKSLPLADLKRYWPPDAAKNGREWVFANMIDGRVGQARVAFAGASVDGLDGFTPESLVGTFNYSDIALRYFEPMPVLTKGRGTATLGLDGLSFAVTGGETNGVQIESGKVAISGLDGDEERLSVEAVARGGMRQIFELLDRPRLGYAKELGVNPRDVGGEAAVRLAIRLPLLNSLTFKQVEIAASATSRGLSLPKVALDQDMTEGAFTLQLDGNGMDVAGTARIGGVPATIAWAETFNARDVARRLNVKADVDDGFRKAIGLDLGDAVAGPAAVDLTLTETAKKAKSLAVTADLARVELNLSPIGWRKDAGVPGTLKADIAMAGERLTAIRSFAVEAGDLRAGGSAVFAADGRLSAVRLDRMVYGYSDIAADIGLRAAGGFDVAIKGRALDVEPFFNLDGEEAADPNALPIEDPPPLAIKLAVDTLRLGEGGGLTDASGTLRREGKLWREIAIDGHPAPGKSFILRLLPDGTNRRVVLQSDDAGSVLKALDVTQDFVGGRLSIEGRYDDSQAARGDPPLAGTALIENFHLINAPGLAKLLSVASLTGILNILRGDGISFDRFDAPFTLKDDVIVTKGLKMHGASLGFTAEGWVSLRDDTLALRGTVVPAYTLNSVLGNIPLLGRLLTGGDGGGVFAATYRMTGKLDDPDVSVNPLATLTPGFLRGLFGIFEGEMPAPGADPAEREAPPPKAPVGGQN
ncbi:MAG: AsmA-like C-terminal domain-containing protein [Alphaproteobacteria bacterium]